MEIFMGLVGIVVLLAIALALSTNRSAINLRTVGGAFAIQLALGAFVLYVPFGQQVLEAISNLVQSVIDSAQAGMDFVFAGLVSDKMFELFGGGGFIFAFRVLPVIIFFSAFMAVLYYLGIMQWVIKIFGGALEKMLGTSRAESLSATANIFVGQTEAPLVVRPFVAKMTQSELFAVMVGGLASVAGSILAALAGIGVEIKYLIAASFMAAPGGLLMAKIMVPETGKPIENLTDAEAGGDQAKPINVIDAAATGASSGLQLALNVGAMLLAFIGLIALLNNLVGWTGGLVGYQDITIELILGYIFSPLAFVMGVPAGEVIQAGSLIGQKMVLNEFVAYFSFVDIREGLSGQTQVIMTFALCGFANFSSIAILLGGLGTIAPSRRPDIAKFGIRAVIAGSLSNFMSATLAGLFMALGAS
ncbi:NupC/NupG family nucleoside CNT transporter [Motilimonas pumila]|uniref:Nucleoside permease n=1 Tax=Motilimonas pumila TaxID=2303987 RepID=A0A418YK87_9GAMM|nr:NupC/NupG family nucleoside CNT transporter [Motilimonas pumila]RJG51381.1 NupC/NupG family nucleoside CNT transporter [Motilimonas pumila]